MAPCTSRKSQVTITVQPRKKYQRRRARLRLNEPPTRERTSAREGWLHRCRRLVTAASRRGRGGWVRSPPSSTPPAKGVGSQPSGEGDEQAWWLHLNQRCRASAQVAGPGSHPSTAGGYERAWKDHYSSSFFPGSARVNDCKAIGGLGGWKRVAGCFYRSIP